jgi:peptidoglycan/xylan/chitin deacetylase (PgdA/CDA1 family)
MSIRRWSMPSVAGLVVVLLAGTACGPGEPDRSTVHPAASAQPTASAPESVGPTATPSAAPSTRADAGGPEYLKRLPTFDPPPPPVKMQLPAGTNAAWISRVVTDQKVAFLTIDDGWVKRPEALPLFQHAHVPVTLFLTINAVKDNPGYFRPLAAAGAVIEAHTLTHTGMVGKSYDWQKHEACGSADQLGAWYGRRPLLFRPPGGEKDATTLRAVHDCSMKAALFWKETVDKGVVRFQSGSTVQPGDIILMHFRDRFVDDFIAALQAIKNAGLTPALLEDYLL